MAKRCKNCGTFISGVFDTCINCSGLKLPANYSAGQQVTLVQSGSTSTLKPTAKKKKEQLIGNVILPDNRNGTTRLVKTYEEVYDIDESSKLYDVPSYIFHEFSFRDISRTEMNLLYQMYMEEQTELIRACIKKTIGTWYTGRIENSLGYVLFKLTKQLENDKK